MFKSCTIYKSESVAIEFSVSKKKKRKEKLPNALLKGRAGHLDVSRYLDVKCLLLYYPCHPSLLLFKCYECSVGISGVLQECLVG